MVNCPDCDKYFSDNEKMEDHKRNTHGGKQTKLFKAYAQTNYSANYTDNDWYDVGRFMVENHIKAHPNGPLVEYKVHMLERGIPEEIVNIVMDEAGLSKKAIPFGPIILGLIAGAGGFATGQFLRKKLIAMGLSPVDAGKNINDAINRVYAMRDRNMRVVRKGQGVSFICNEFTSKDVNRVINLTGNNFEDKQQLRMKDVVTTGDGFTGEIIGIQGNHATILNKENDEKRYLHMKSLMKSENIIYTKDRGMSTWDGLNLLERQAILKDINAPIGYAGRDWVGVEKTVKDIIKNKYGEKINKSHECKECGDKFGDKDEYDDHMQHHKNKTYEKHPYKKREDGDNRCATCDYPKGSIVHDKKKAQYQETGHSKKYSAEYIINGNREYHAVIADNDIHAVGFLMMHLQNDHAGATIDSIKLTIDDTPTVNESAMPTESKPHEPRVVFKKSYSKHIIKTKGETTCTDCGHKRDSSWDDCYICGNKKKKSTMGGNGEQNQHFQRIGRDAKKFDKVKATETGGVYHGDSGDAGDRDESSKQGNKDDNTFDQIKETKKKKSSRIYKSVDLRNPMMLTVRKEKVNSENTAKQFYEDIGTDATDKPDKTEKPPKPKDKKTLPNLPNHEPSGYAFRA